MEAKATRSSSRWSATMNCSVMKEYVASSYAQRGTVNSGSKLTGSMSMNHSSTRIFVFTYSNVSAA